MIIHLIGHAGCGKTSLAKAIHEARPALRPRSERDKVALQPRALANLALPGNYAIGRDLAVFNRDAAKGPGPWLWAYKIALEKARQHVGGDWVIDHGFTNTMRKKVKPINPKLAQRLPFPDVIVNIGTRPTIRTARICKRNKSPSKVLPLTGDVRLQVAVRYARQWLRIWPEGVVLDYLIAFGRHRCHPILTTAELQAIVSSEKGAPLTEADHRALSYTPVPESYAWLKDMFEAQGGTWIDFENSGISDLQAAAEELLSRLPLR